MGSLKRKIRNAGLDLIYRSTLKSNFGMAPAKSERRKLLSFATACVNAIQTGMKELTK